MTEDRDPDSPENRRQFLFGAAGALAATWIASQWPAIAAAHAAAAAAVAGGEAALTFLSPMEARDVEAIVAQLVPADQDPGAREAGALYFIDRSLTTWCSGHATEFRDGLHGFQAKFVAIRPDGGFADADESAQQAFLRDEEKSDFFGMTRALTLIGLFAAPHYGGNRDAAGWRLIGFEDEHVFAPPFGYYDRDYPGFKAR